MLIYSACSLILAVFLHGVLFGVLWEILRNRWNTEGSFEGNEVLEEKSKEVKEEEEVGIELAIFRVGAGDDDR